MQGNVFMNEILSSKVTHTSTVKSLRMHMNARNSQMVLNGNGPFDLSRYTVNTWRCENN